MRWMFLAVIAAVAAIAAQAAEKPGELKQGAGRDKVVAHCNACHSLDYIEMNAGFLDFAGWDAEVAKMIGSFGAPVDAADAKAIAQYLGATYGARPQPGDQRAASSAPAPPGRAGIRHGPRSNASWLTGGPRGPRAASRRHHAEAGPFESLFSKVAEATTCKTAKAEKYRARVAPCENQTRRAHHSSSRQARWHWVWPWSRSATPHS
jgi:hypothetical protein